MYTHREITLDDVRKRAPSVFAQNPHPDVSGRYKFIPTTAPMGLLIDAGWVPTSASQSSAKSTDGISYSKHCVRFRRKENLQVNGFNAELGDLVPEIILYNSHNRSSAFKLVGGLFRCVCTNQMVVSDTTLASASIRHVGFQDRKILDAQYRIIDEFPKLLKQVTRFNEIELKPEEQRVFADAAVKFRWEEGKAPITGNRLNSARRNADVGNTLWKTLNRVQENLIKGGQTGWTPKLLADGRLKTTRATSRAVKSIDGDKKLNIALWTMAEEMAKLKSA